MDRQDVTRELGQPGARELLESATLTRLAYNGPDGLPRVIPIAFYWDGERIVVCTATTSPKVRALSARPDVAITIDVGDTPAAAKSLLCAASRIWRPSTASPTSTSRRRRRRWTLTRTQPSKATSGRCTNSRCASRSNHGGLGSTTSAPAAYPPS